MSFDTICHAVQSVSVSVSVCLYRDSLMISFHIHIQKTVKSSAKRWSSSSVDRLIDLDWSQWSPKVKIKSTYRISNCQHQAECGSHVPNWGSCWRIICNLLSKVISTLGGPKLFHMPFWHRFLFFFFFLFRIMAFITISCWSTLTTNGGNVHRSLFVIRYSLVDSFVRSFVCLSCHSFKHLIVRRQNANR